MRADEFASLFPGALGNFEHALFIGGVTGSLTAHVANSITGNLTVCDFDNARLSELKQLQSVSKPISFRHVLPAPAGSADIKTAYLCSETTHSSLSRPSMIGKKMPGLTFSDTQISTLSVDELVAGMGLNDSLPNLLVISVTGFEELWLDPEVDLLRYFDTVLIRLPLTGWFDTTLQGDQLLSNMAQPGIALPFGSLPYRWWMIRRPVGWGAQQRASREVSNQFLQRVEELEQAEERTVALEAKLKDQTGMTDSLQESLASKDDELEQAKERTAALEAKLSDQAEMSNALQELLASKDHDLEQAMARATELEAKLSDQTEMSDALQESLASKDHDLEQAMERLATVENDLSSALKQAEAHEAEVTSLQSDLANSLNARSSLESELSGSHQTIDDLKAELEQQTKWHHDNKHWAESLKRELDNKLVALDEVEARESRLKEAIKTHDVTVANLQSTVSEKQSRIDSLEKDQRESEYCQKLLDDEIVKAEAQLELIKDVVLRDKAF